MHVFLAFKRDQEQIDAGSGEQLLEISKVKSLAEDAIRLDIQKDAQSFERAGIEFNTLQEAYNWLEQMERDCFNVSRYRVQVQQVKE